jgi:fructose/tagatose bisphosphate aldolase
VIDFWFGVVHGDYVPKPSYYTYRMVGQVEDTIYLPLVLSGTTSP